jgi:hypothetical protein
MAHFLNYFVGAHSVRPKKALFCRAHTVRPYERLQIINKCFIWGTILNAVALGFFLSALVSSTKTW